jgi:sterol desaturase/sphingolipid hydroxylase (fatty acid hydroxylase superfamily)
MNIPDLSSPYSFLITMLILYVIITGRYLLVSGIFYIIFYKWYRAKWAYRKLGKKEYTSKQFRREIMWSCISAVCFSFTGTMLLLLWQKGMTSIYTDINEYPLWWMPASLIISLLIDETYYYWVHRWMHHPAIFRHIHKVHHQSTISSPWTSFAFHPIEGMLLSLPFVCTLIFIPMHVSVIFLQLAIMTVSSIINHLDIEIYSEAMRKNKIGKLLIGASHHALHHKQFKYNFGLYFTFWDKLKNTESPSLR